MYIVRILKAKSKIEGYGVFAGEYIPKGTIVFFYGKGDSFVPKERFQSSSEDEKELFYKYGVEDEAGNWLVKEDDINHSCDSNILSLFVDGIYCDIAVKDINPGEEMTIDYGLFYSSFPWSEECRCNSPICRKIFGSGWGVNRETQDMWHSRILEAVARIFEVKQNLFSLEDENARALTTAMKSKRNPKIFPYVKFSLIS
ncbi:MAG TPA: SET domain-containing protein [Methanothrix sp.]|nr:SET domain-containing protein [Methanothrix sp.]